MNNNNNQVSIIEVENCTSNVSQHTHNIGQTVVVITGSPNFITPASFGTKPQIIICPYCHYEVTTKTETKATMKTHLFALLLCIFSCGLVGSLVELQSGKFWVQIWDWTEFLSLAFRCGSTRCRFNHWFYIYISLVN